MAKKRLLGIKLLFELMQTGDDALFNVLFYVDYGYKSRNFVSNSVIRKALKKESLKSGNLIGKFFGSMSIYFNSNNKTARWSIYRPLSLNSSFFSDKGIAQFLEYKTLIELKKRFPLVERIKHSAITFNREKQLVRRGHKATNFGYEYSFKEGIRLLRNKIRRNKRNASHRKRKLRVKPK